MMKEQSDVVSPDQPVTAPLPTLKSPICTSAPLKKSPGEILVSFVFCDAAASRFVCSSCCLINDPSFIHRHLEPIVRVCVFREGPTLSRKLRWNRGGGGGGDSEVELNRKVCAVKAAIAWTH